MRALETFVHQMDSAPTKSAMAPAIVVQALARTCRECDDDWYRPRHQADAAECIQYLLEAIHDSIHRTVRIRIEGAPKTAAEVSQQKALESWSTFFTKEYSPIVENFYGQTQIQIRCESCRVIRERYEPWMMLKVPIPGAGTAGAAAGAEAPNMQACLDELFAPETLEDYECETCKGRRAATIFTRISKLSNILILTIKRFDNRMRKIRGTIVWDPDFLSFRPWMSFGRDPFTNRKLQTEYQTFAVIEHNGSVGGGHYRMYARGEDADVWRAFDDDTTMDATATQVVNPDSYVLFMCPRPLS
jgi:ubiquitin C-terminal hydrolase